MKEKLQKEFDEIQENLEILPKNNEKNRKKYHEYIDKNLDKYNELFDEAAQEIESRYQQIKEKYTQEVVPTIKPLDYQTVKILDPKNNSMEKMNLPRYFYELRHFYDNNLDRINAVILEIINSFKEVGINLKYEDFNYSEVVEEYIKTLLTNSGNIDNKFEDLFWANHNLINQIEMNFKHIYYSNEKRIDKFYEIKYADLNYQDYLDEYMVRKAEYAIARHSNKHYLLNQFLDKKVILQTLSPKNIKDTIIQLLPTDDINNYDYLIKLEDSLKEYKNYMSYEYIIKDFKKLIENKESYKDQFENKLKEIEKKESELFKRNKKINSNSIFRPKGKKKEKLIYERNNIINELNDLYKELDDLKITDSIYKNVSENTSYLDALIISLNNFEYLIKCLKTENDEITIDVIDKCIYNLSNYVYESNINLINNVLITEEKNLSQIIADRYKMSNIKLEESQLEKDLIDNILTKVLEIITYYDVKKTNFDTKEVEFLIETEKIIDK